MQKLHIDEDIFELPSNLNEMTFSQLEYLSKLLEEEVGIQEVKTYLLFFCLSASFKELPLLGRWRIVIQKSVFTLTTEEVLIMSSAFDFLFTTPDEDGNCFFDNRLTTLPDEVLRIGNVEYVSPGEALTDCNYDQYIYLLTYWAMKDSTHEAIYHFMAALYLPNGSAFTKNDIEKRAASMRHCTPTQIVLSIWYWIGSCRYLSDKFPRIYFDSEGGDGQGNPYEGQQRLLDFMTNADVAKKEIYKANNLYDVLYSLDFLLEKKEMESEHAKALT